MSGIVTVWISPTAIVSIASSSSIASSPSPTDTTTFTSVSVFSPWFCTWTSKARSPVSWTVVPVAPGVSVVPPSVTAARPLPCSPGAASSSVAPPVPERRAFTWSATKAASSHSTSGTNVLGREGGHRELLLLERLPQPRPEAGHVDRVAGQEHLHRLGHVLGALAPVLVAERGAHRVGREGEAVAAQLEHVEEVAVGVVQLVGDVEAARPVDPLARRDAVGVEVVLDLHRLVGAALALQQLEQLRRPPASTRA